METLFSYKATCNNNLLVTQIIMAETLCRGEKFTIILYSGFISPSQNFYFEQVFLSSFFPSTHGIGKHKIYHFKIFFSIRTSQTK